MSTNGGDTPSQIPQKTICMSVQMGMMNFGAPDISNPLSLLPEAVLLKARTTVMVFAKTVETATVKMTPNVVCCRMQVAVLG